MWAITLSWLALGGRGEVRGAAVQLTAVAMQRGASAGRAE